MLKQMYCMVGIFPVPQDRQQLQKRVAEDERNMAMLTRALHVRQPHPVDDLATTPAATAAAAAAAAAAAGGSRRSGRKRQPPAYLVPLLGGWSRCT